MSTSRVLLTGSDNGTISGASSAGSLPAGGIPGLRAGDIGGIMGTEYAGHLQRLCTFSRRRERDRPPHRSFNIDSTDPLASVLPLLGKHDVGEGWEYRDQDSLQHLTAFAGGARSHLEFGVGGVVDGLDLRCAAAATIVCCHVLKHRHRPAIKRRRIKNEPKKKIIAVSSDVDSPLTKKKKKKKKRKLKTKKFGK